MSVLNQITEACSSFLVSFCRYESCHDKTNIMGLRPAWIQTSLRIRAVWSGSMLFAISFSTCYRICTRTAWMLIRLRGCAGWSGSMLVANPLCFFCHDAAHIIFYDILCNHWLQVKKLTKRTAVLRANSEQVCL
jgi:hypothetical protein